MYKLKFMLHKVPPKVIYSFKDGDTRTTLMKKTDVTSSHICSIIRKFEDNGITTQEIQGRKKIIHLTEKGKEIQELFRLLIEL